MCSEFVTPQKYVFLTTEPNVNDQQNCQVCKVRFQNNEKTNSILSPEPLVGKAGNLSQVSNNPTTWEMAPNRCAGLAQPEMFEQPEPESDSEQYDTGLSCNRTQTNFVTLSTNNIEQNLICNAK